MTAVGAGSPVLVFFALLGASVWVGGFVTIALVSRVARRQLDRGARVAFFRALGRSYVAVGGSALVVAFACGAVLLDGRAWDGTAIAAVAVGIALAVVTAGGVAQARGMTRLRHRALRGPGDRALAVRVRRGAVRATILRAAIGVLSLALLVLVAVLAT